MSKIIPRLPSCISVPIPKDELLDIVVKAKDWALMHGASMRSKTNFSEDSLEFAPFILLPSSFPRKEFKKAVHIQTIFNELIHRVANHRQFLTACLKETIQVDEFTGNLFKIYQTVEDEGVAQPLSLGLVRCDYMLESLSCKDDNSNGHPSVPFACVLVEYNTIAAGFGWLGPLTAEIHRYVLQELGHQDKLENLPENHALSGLCQGLVEAWKIYGNPKGIILFVVEEVTMNICDQRFLEFEIRRANPQSKIIRRTFTQIGDNALLSKDNELVIDTNVVSVVYFRAGYEPDHYPTKKEWDARLLIERSQAIKCPNIQYHLAGTKKVQQELAKVGALEMFLAESSKIDSIRDVFIGLYGLDFDESGDRAVQMALDDPERFVLKPQREGGGNNIYGLEIREAMLKMKDKKERTAWILMERILPPAITGYLLRPGGPNPPPTCDLVSELGIFGVVIGDSQKILVNRQVGHMLRTKSSASDEGGVAAGSGALDSPYLID